MCLTVTEAKASVSSVSPRAAWLGLMATGLGTLAGGLSAQAQAMAGADLGGGFGLSADEASWIQTAGSMAEVASVLIAAPLFAAVGGRRLVAGGALVTGMFALLLTAAPAATAPLLRAGHGFAMGMLTVAMMVWAMRAFPPQRRGLPLMLFAFASSAPTALAPQIAGWLTAHLGGRGVFYFDIIWALPVAGIAWACLPREPLAWPRLLGLDWLGYALLAGGSMALVAVLAQGERRVWGAAPWIPAVATLAAILIAAALTWMLATARSPLLDLALFLRPGFAIAIGEAFSLRFALLLASFAVPQALVRLAGFRVEQAGEAVLWMLGGQLLGFPLAWFWTRGLDARWALAAGLALFAAAALWCSRLDAAWGAEQFVPALVAAGIGQGLFLTSVMTFVTHGLPAAAGATAAGLFNLTRVLGTALATCCVAVLLRVRENAHSARLGEGLTFGNDNLARWVEAMAANHSQWSPDAAAASGAALGVLQGAAARQAFALGFADVFLGIAAVLALFTVLVPLLPRLAPFQEGS
ncbi:MAG: transporter [Rubritepida sp.]|nr:transporter [Rubritepida sp.]